MPKISVIVSVYKTAKYMRKCIDSILNQTFKDIEIILVSDGSNEEHSICDEYALKDNRVRLLRDIGKGLGGARNAGMEIAQSEYIAFVDSDDWIEPQTYEKAIEYFNDEIDLVVFGVNVTGLESSITAGVCDYVKLKSSGKQLLDKDKILNTNVSAWNKLYKKSIIDKYNLRFPENLQYEDFPFYFQYCFVSSGAYYLNKPFYNYFQREDSGMAKTYAKEFNYVKDHILGCKFLYEELNKKGLYQQNKGLFSDIFTRWIKIGLNYCKKQDKIKYLTLAYNISKQMCLEDNLTLKCLKTKKFKPIIKDITKEQNIYLFGLIPILNIKYYKFNKIKIYLFGIMIFKINLKREVNEI